MEQVGFIGAMDKKDLLLNVGSVLAKSGLKVLLIDATSVQRLRYVVPMVESTPTMTFISEYCGVDVAVGFMNYAGIAQYLRTQNLPYDIIMVDSDNIQTVSSFGLIGFKKKFIVTSYDVFEENKIMEILRYVRQPFEIDKVIFSPDITAKQDAYLNHLLSETTAQIGKHTVLFNDADIDKRANLQNQLVKNITFKKFTSSYRASLEYLTSIIAEGILKQDVIRQTIKRIW